MVIRNRNRKFMKNLKDLTKKELIEEYSKLKEMFAETLNKLTTTAIKLCDTAIEERKLRIENEELKQKLNKHENN